MTCAASRRRAAWRRASQVRSPRADDRVRAPPTRRAESASRRRLYWSGTGSTAQRMRPRSASSASGSSCRPRRTQRRASSATAASPVVSASIEASERSRPSGSQWSVLARRRHWRAAPPIGHHRLSGEIRCVPPTPVAGADERTRIRERKQRRPRATRRGPRASARGRGRPAEQLRPAPRRAPPTASCRQPVRAESRRRAAGPRARRRTAAVASVIASTSSGCPIVTAATVAGPPRRAGRRSVDGQAVAHGVPGIGDERGAEDGERKQADERAEPVRESVHRSRQPRPRARPARAARAKRDP